ncbi:hypothetical protein Tco_0762023 [Tanacetum coccineum]
MSRVLFNRITEKQSEQHEEVAVSYADLKASIDQYYDENIAHRDQTDKLVEASMISLNRSNTTISDLYKGLDVITQLLKDINNVVKDDPATNQKLNEATETFTRISSKLTEIALKSEVSSLRQDTSEIKSMMVEIYKAFKGQPSSTLSGSVTPTLALTHIPANVKGENATTTATEEPPSHTEGETGDTTMAIPISSIHPTKVQPTHDQPITSVISHPESSHATLRIDKGKGIATESDVDPSKRIVPASTIIRPDPDEPVRKVVEEAKLLAMSRPEDAEHEVLKREHSKKVKRLTELNRRRDEEYMNNDIRNFDIHQPFRFSDFEITELDELGPIRQKKKNSVVKDLMTSLSKRYERLKKVPEELGIQSALPALVPEQASS